MFPIHLLLNADAFISLCLACERQQRHFPLLRCRPFHQPAHFQTRNFYSPFVGAYPEQHDAAPSRISAPRFLGQQTCRLLASQRARGRDDPRQGALAATAAFSGGANMQSYTRPHTHAANYLYRRRIRSARVIQNVSPFKAPSHASIPADGIKHQQAMLPTFHETFCTQEGCPFGLLSKPVWRKRVKYFT